MNNQEPTNRDLSNLMNQMMSQMNQWMDKVEQRMDKVDRRMGGLEKTIQDLAVSVQLFATNTEKRLSRIESTMVTKEYLDERLSHLTGRIVRKTDALVEHLVAEKSLSRPSADRILAMPPSLESL